MDMQIRQASTKDEHEWVACTKEINSVLKLKMCHLTQHSIVCVSSMKSSGSQRAQKSLLKQTRLGDWQVSDMTSMVTVKRREGGSSGLQRMSRQTQSHCISTAPASPIVAASKDFKKSLHEILERLLVSKKAAEQYRTEPNNCELFG